MYLNYQGILKLQSDNLTIWKGILGCILIFPIIFYLYKFVSFFERYMFLSKIREEEEDEEDSGLDAF
jgi:Fe2+ transport system protein B